MIHFLLLYTQLIVGLKRVFNLKFVNQKNKWSSEILLQRFLIEVSVEVYGVIGVDQYFRIDLSHVINNVS